MFELCPLIDNRKCAFEGTKVKNLPKCTKEMSKYEKTKHGKLF